MPDVEHLHIEDALEDSPQTRHLLTVFEKDAMLLKKFTQNMHNCCQRIMSAQNELCAATQSLAQHLRSFGVQKFPLESEDSVLSSTLLQFSTFLDDISSVQQVLAQQFSETMMYPLNKFLQADIEEISTMYEMFKIATNEHEQSLAKYMKQPMKKDDKSRVEVNEELYANRKKFHQTALHYYSSLNALQYKRKCFLLEPVMGYLHAQRACFQMGQDIILRADVEEFLGNIGSSVQGVHSDLAKETQKTVELIENIEKQSQHMYHAEPPADMPFIPPNTNLTQKAGYLFCRGKQVLLTTRWDRMYFFTQGGNLMSQTKEEFAGSLVMDLNEEGVLVESCVADERRHTFQLVAPISKKTVVLQAENYRERDEWIATLNNIIRDGGYMKGKPASAKKKEPPRKLSNSQSSDSTSGTGAQTPVGSNQVSVPTSISAPGAADTLILDTPIQFDLVTPGEENRAITSPQSGPPKRLNPFDQSSAIVLNPAFDNAAFSETFSTRFLGSMEVKGDRGEQLVHSTIRQIMAARAIHNIFKMTESLMVVSSEGMRLIDPSNNVIRVEFALQDISFWSAHPDNNRLFGFITRNRVMTNPPETKSAEGDKNPVPTFACHVFESNTTAEDICQAISTATKVAYQALMEKRKGVTTTTTPKPKAVINEKNLLLKNIQSLPEDCGVKNNKYGIDEVDSIQDTLDDDLSARLPLSPDGKFLILTAIDEPPSPTLTSPVSSLKQSEDSTGAEAEESESEA
ncbi:DCC-interacting protein 13-alpha-like isoform X2 [Physella acuta]|uniref:DCC-interacting protein 13-alpha-like isoform X2 n=1 Tax=Physella acuta TaxID=109671 RepID=UPI0027DE31A0|nr:DCC-interacting protein 13-alpha-like isoform X2 [Physella acuta]